MRSTWIALLLALWSGEAPAGGVVPVGEPKVLATHRGIVVEEISENSALAKAGIKPEDVLHTWRRLPEQPGSPASSCGELASVWDWTLLEMEQAPRGVIELVGERRGVEAIFTVLPGSWEARVRPWMPEAALAEYVKGRALEQSGQSGEAADVWMKLHTATDPDSWKLRSWLLLRVGESLLDASEPSPALDAILSAILESRDPLVESVLWEASGRSHELDNNFLEARKAYQAACRIREEVLGTSTLSVAQCLEKTGGIDWQRGELITAEKNLTDCLGIVGKLAPRGQLAAEVLNTIGLVYMDRGDLIKALDAFERGLAVLEELAPESLGFATNLNNLGLVHFQRRDLDQATSFFERSLEIRRRVAPGALDVAQALNNLAAIARFHGDLDRASALLREALEIRSKHSPNSLSVAVTLNNVSAITHDQGNLAEAEDLSLRSLHIREQLAPDSLAIANSWTNLGVMAEERGFLDRSLDYHRRALAVRQRLAPSGRDVALSLTNLGLVEQKRGDLLRADDYHQKALEILEKVDPNGLDLARALGNLGVVKSRRGRLDLALRLHERALRIQRTHLAGSLDVANSLGNLGVVATRQGKLQRAESLLAEALEVSLANDEDGFDTAANLRRLAFVAEKKGEFSRSAALFRKALETWSALAPESIDIAVLLSDLARLSLKETPPDLRRSLDLLLESEKVLESQVARLGAAAEVREEFRADYGFIFKNLVRTQLILGQKEAAYGTLERYRARVFLEQLAEREGIFERDLPEELRRERERVAFLINQSLAGLRGVAEHDGEKVEAVRLRQRQLRERQRDLEEEIRRTSRRVATVRYPRPLDLAATCAMLDPGSLLLSFSVGETSTLLFAVGDGCELRVVIVDISERDLDRRVESMRSDVGLSRSQDPNVRERFRSEGRALFTLLLGPVNDLIDASERIMIVPDGPLHLLPWGALLRGSEKGSPTTLVELRPFHVAVSATGFSEIKVSRPLGEEEAKPMRIAAFGDPKVPQSRQDVRRWNDSVVRPGSERSVFEWTPLPHTRREVRAIADLFRNGEVQVYLGEDASEARACGLDRGVGVVHFATHGSVDEESPLSSFLVLSIPEEFVDGKENGLLQGWEIMERMRLGASLVVLSGCETALGEERGGEGLIGLTRAFQYAGARSVLASLWSVQDQATSELMIRFYKHFRAGLTKDEALRQAQLELIGGPIEVVDESGQRVLRDFSAPYYWAGFQLYGDWK